MGYNDDGASRLIFDLETAPLPDAADYLEPAEAPANYKDPAKIAAYIEQANAEALAKCGLDVDLCRVVAIGMQLEGCAVDTGTTERMTEADLLGAFWNVARDRHLVGFACLQFDLPVLLRRSLYLGVPAPHIQIDRFKHPRVTDLMDELSFGGKLRLRGLSFYCRRFGIAVADELTGAEIAAAVAAGEWERIARHVEADVEKTAQLAARLGYFSGVVVSA